MARRIVLPVLGLIGALFLLLGFFALRIADRRVEQDLESVADRVASALEGLPVPPDRLPDVLPSLGRLVGAEIAVRGRGFLHGTRSDLGWPDAGRAEIGGGAWRVLARRATARPEREGYRVLMSEEFLTRRHRDLLRPIVIAGATGLVVAALLGIGVARTLARPVRALAERAGRVSAGDFSGEIARSGPGEVGDLEEAFGRMLTEIRESQARLRESERFAALGRLAGGIAHELRNPLTAIRMAVETSLREDAASREEARKVALAEIDRLDRTLRELLDFVRPRKPRLVDTSIALLLRSCVDLLRPQCEHLKVRLDLDVPEGLGLRFRVDPDRIRQAVLNLVLNGAQAQPRGGVVRIEARPGVISVSDEGPGIAEEVRGTLFQPFVTTKSAGIGIGLAVVKQVMEEHGGSVDYETGPGGTTFFLRLPA